VNHMRRARSAQSTTVVCAMWHRTRIQRVTPPRRRTRTARAAHRSAVRFRKADRERTQQQRPHIRCRSTRRTSHNKPQRQPGLTARAARRSARNSRRLGTRPSGWMGCCELAICAFWLCVAQPQIVAQPDGYFVRAPYSSTHDTATCREVAGRCEKERRGA